MSIIKFKQKQSNIKSDVSYKKEELTSTVINFKSDKSVTAEVKPLSEEPVFGYAWPMGQFMITNIPGMGHFATLIIKDNP